MSIFGKSRKNPFGFKHLDELPRFHRDVKEPISHIRTLSPTDSELSTHSAPYDWEKEVPELSGVDSSESEATNERTIELAPIIGSIGINSNFVDNDGRIDPAVVNYIQETPPNHRPESQ